MPISSACACTPQYGNGTLRLTTRQCYQLHGVLKVRLDGFFHVPAGRI